MFKWFMAVTALLALVVVVPASGDTADKTGTPVRIQPAPPSTPSSLLIDWEYNTGGAINTVPTTGGSATGWAEWFVTTVQNTTGQPLHLVEFGFPCAGPPTGQYGWVVWPNFSNSPPPGPPESAPLHGPFTPVDPDPNTFPPTVYTYVPVAGENIIVPAGDWFTFGYDNTGMGGMISYNGVETWGWYQNMWDPDSFYGRTAVLQVRANYAGATAVGPGTWGAVKALF